MACDCSSRYVSQNYCHFIRNIMTDASCPPFFDLMIMQQIINFLHIKDEQLESAQDAGHMDVGVQTKQSVRNQGKDYGVVWFITLLKCIVTTIWEWKSWSTLFFLNLPNKLK